MRSGSHGPTKKEELTSDDTSTNATPVCACAQIRQRELFLFSAEIQQGVKSARFFFSLVFAHLLQHHGLLHRLLELHRLRHGLLDGRGGVRRISQEDVKSRARGDAGG